MLRFYLLSACICRKCCGAAEEASHAAAVHWGYTTVGRAKKSTEACPGERRQPRTEQHLRLRCSLRKCLAKRLKDRGSREATG